MANKETTYQEASLVLCVSRINQRAKGWKAIKAMVMSRLSGTALSTAMTKDILTAASSTKIPTKIISVRALKCSDTLLEIISGMKLSRNLSIELFLSSMDVAGCC